MTVWGGGFVRRFVLAHGLFVRLRLVVFEDTGEQCLNPICPWWEGLRPTRSAPRDGIASLRARGSVHARLSMQRLLSGHIETPLCYLIAEIGGRIDARERSGRSVTSAVGASLAVSCTSHRWPHVLHS
jgi:hypothetical protein